MDLLLSMILLSIGMVALMLGYQLMQEDTKQQLNRMVFIAAMLVFGWNFGYAFIGMSQSLTLAYIARTFSASGVLMYLTYQIHIFAVFADMPKKKRIIIISFFYTMCIVLLAHLLHPENVSFVRDVNGYYIKPLMGPLRIFQGVYMGLAVIGSYYVLYYWDRKSNKKRIRNIIKNLCPLGVIMTTCSMADFLMANLLKVGTYFNCFGGFLSFFILHRVIKKYNSYFFNTRQMGEIIYAYGSTPVLLLDENSRIRIVNNAAYDMLDAPAEEIFNRNIGKFFSYKSGKGFYFQRLDSGINRMKDDAIFKKNGKECTILTTAVNDSYGDVMTYICFVYDTSAEHEYIRALEKSRQETEDAYKAKSNFLANMSHEIRTPMNAIIGMSDIILRGELTEEQQSQIGNIKMAGNILLRIINDVLDISKIESGKYDLLSENYDLPNLITDITNMTEIRLEGKPIKFEVIVDSTLPRRLVGDSMRIKQVLINILGNAAKYTEQGLIILNVNWNRDKENPELVLSVKDTGTGIREEDLDKIFEIFNQINTTKGKNIQSSGLGLALSKNLLELMGGHIEVESVYGEGSTFRVYIPQKNINYEAVGDVIATQLIHKTYKPLGQKGDKIKALKMPNAKVLVVDDNKVNLLVVKGLLKIYEVQVDFAESGQEAISMIQEKPYNLIFMDHMMPGLDGVDTTKMIRQMNNGMYRKIPIVALTANVLKEARSKFTEAGMVDFLAKPIDPQELDRIMSTWVPQFDEGAQMDVVEAEATAVSDSHTEEAIDESMKETAGMAMEEASPGQKDESEKETTEPADSEAGVPILDTELGLQTVGGNESNYRLILETYVVENGKKLLNLESLIDSDLRLYTTIVHAFKGSSRTIGAIPLGDVCEMLEKAGKAGETEYLKRNTGSMIAEMETVFEEIKKYLE